MVSILQIGEYLCCFIVLSILIPNYTDKLSVVFAAYDAQIAGLFFCIYTTSSGFQVLFCYYDCFFQCSLTVKLFYKCIVLC
jgi:hypothetical protein